MWQSSRQKVNNETLHRIYVEKDFKKSVNLQSKIVDLMCSWIKNSWNGNFIMAEISFHFDLINRWKFSLIIRITISGTCTFHSNHSLFPAFC